MVISGIIIGVLLGWVLQRGRVCMNSGFRDMILVQNTEIFRAFLAALLIMIIGANILEDTGVIKVLYRQGFMPIANIFGGYIFGVGIVMASGCASGIWFKIGEGTVPAWVSVLGFFVGILTTSEGMLFRLYQALSNYQVWLTGNGLKLLTTKEVEAAWASHSDIYPLTLYNLFGINKWIVVAVLGAAFLFIIFKGDFKASRSGYSWYVAGPLLGIIGIAAWWASDFYGGKVRGMSFTGPTVELFKWVMQGDDPTWSVFLILGMVFGSYLSSRRKGEFKVKSCGGNETVDAFLGGFLMGFGAVVGGGCNIGHGLTGASTLAVSSFVTIIFIMLGNWSMVYIRFIRPMHVD
ncbi:YeeE/YedE family protein [Candidatus Magnetominusculus xianensis]|uniref:Inner membrane protein n=1 Tax=Candidatus Magnetominusculus xianensis TaxID=1748249 RepID=A0ABR5SHB5_9BACT|nr:YeeE/YedE family protein [Candidatus Magnetominusculus xianensis]KWT86910.1 putative inner membrane protein [Candidatus Magnetominusculus xianensis]MBF0405021.1 YeeE/YedE family protein [Nitrospirota bacterium]